MKLTTVNVPEGLVEGLDRLVQRGRYPNRVEAIRDAIKRLTDEHQKFRQMGEEKHCLRDIALDELEKGHHGGFLTHFLEAYIRADPSNKRVLRPAMKTLVEKYELKLKG